MTRPFLARAAVFTSIVLLSCLITVAANSSRDRKTRKHVTLSSVVRHFAPDGWTVEQFKDEEDRKDKSLLKGDIDGDGDTEIVFAVRKKYVTERAILSEPYYHKIIILDRKGHDYIKTWEWPPGREKVGREEISLNEANVELSLKDINRDGKAEIVMFFPPSPQEDRWNRLCIFMHKGTAYAKVHDRYIREKTWTDAFNDLDKDGIEEIVTEYDFYRDIYRKRSPVLPWVRIIKWNGEVYTQANNLFPRFYRERIVNYGGFLEKFPRDVHVRKYLIEAYKALESYDKIPEQYETAIASASSDQIKADFSYALAQFHEERGDLGKALKEYRRTCTFDKANSARWRIRKIQCQILLAAEPDNVGLRRKYADLMSQTDPEVAVREYEKLLKMIPDSAEIYLLLGRTYAMLLSSGYMDESIKCYTKALHLDHTLYDAHRELGDLYRLKGKEDEAIREYKLYLGKIKDPDERKREEERLQEASGK